DVDEDCVWRAGRRNHHAADAGAAELRWRCGDLQLRVRVDQVLPPDERREIRLVGDVEEDRQDTGCERGGEELPRLQDAERIREWDRGKRDSASEVSDDQQRTSPQPVYPDARGQREEEERELLEDRQRRNRERARVQDPDRGDREREQRHLRAELADRLAAPELEEVAVPPQLAPWPETF